jgi:hypothetical protein
MEIGDVSCLCLHSQRAIWAVVIIYVSQHSLCAIWAVVIIYVSQHSLCLLKVKKDLNSYGRQYNQSQQYEPLLCQNSNFFNTVMKTIERDVIINLSFGQVQTMADWDTKPLDLLLI